MKFPHRFAVILLCIMAAVFAHADDVQYVVSNPCSFDGKGVDHVAERACLEYRLETISGELQAAEGQLRKQMADWDEEEILTQGALDLFDKSVVAFKVYLSLACELDAASAAGGNGAHDMRLLCQHKLIGQRIRLLREQVSLFRG